MARDQGDDMATDLRIAQAMIDEVEPFFDTAIGAAIARKLADVAGFDLHLEILRAKALEEEGCSSR